MNNPHRGEVQLTVNRRTYTLRLASNALVAMEKAMNQKLPQIVSAFNAHNIGIADIRAMLWAALQEYHPSVTLEEAGEILDGIGFEAASEAVGEAFVLSWPANNGRRDEDPKAAPGNGTGTPSSRKRRRPVSLPNSSGGTPLGS